MDVVAWSQVSVLSEDCVCVAKKRNFLNLFLNSLHMMGYSRDKLISLDTSESYR